MAFFSATNQQTTHQRRKVCGDVITGFHFHVEVWVSPDRLERSDNETRSIARVLKEEIQSNLESLPGTFEVTVKQVKPARRRRR